MPVQVNAQLVSVAEDGSECTEELLVLAKQHERLEQLGLSLTNRPELDQEEAAPPRGPAAGCAAAGEGLPGHPQGLPDVRARAQPQGSPDARRAYPLRQAQVGQPACAPVLPLGRCAGRRWSPTG